MDIWTLVVAMYRRFYWCPITFPLFVGHILTAAISNFNKDALHVACC